MCLYPLTPWHTPQLCGSAPQTQPGMSTAKKSGARRRGAFPKFRGEARDWRGYVRILDAMLLERNPRSHRVLHGEHRPKTTRKNTQAAEEWDKANEDLFTILFMSCTGSADPILQAHRSRPGVPADGVGAFRALNELYHNESRACRRVSLPSDLRPYRVEGGVFSSTPGKFHTDAMNQKVFNTTTAQMITAIQEERSTGDGEVQESAAQDLVTVLVPHQSILKSAIIQGLPWHSVLEINRQEADRIVGPEETDDDADASEYSVYFQRSSDGRGDVLRRFCISFRDVYLAVEEAAGSSVLIDLVVLVDYAAQVTRGVLKMPRALVDSHGMVLMCRDFEQVAQEVRGVVLQLNTVDAGATKQMGMKSFRRLFHRQTAHQEDPSTREAVASHTASFDRIRKLVDATNSQGRGMDANKGVSLVL
ncbi:unnamed protein product [Discosporangium mesarthrocarpum]